MMKYLINHDDFSIKSEDNICFIDFKATKSKNAISLIVASFMQSVLNRDPLTNQSIFELFLMDENISLIVMRSLVDNIFSSGGHLSDLISGKKEELSCYGDSVRNFCAIFREISTPSIALLTGNAYGGGVELALASDFRWSIGTEIAFHLIQTKLGVPGGWGGMTRLTELCPNLNPKKVASLFLAQDILNYQNLIQLSLIDKTFFDEKSCYVELFRWRDNITSCHKMLKKDFLLRNEIPLDKMKEYDKDFFKKYFLSPDHKNNIHEFLTKKNKNHANKRNK